MRAPGSVVPVAVLLCVISCLLVARETGAGFACLSNPCMFGVCLDDLNSSYSCFCIDGYTGVQCQTNWDECWSSPCKNGGTCVDGVAQYNCTCPDGFMGDDCEENIDECLSNPCQNNGTCWDFDNGYRCSCIAGFLGTHCEVDVAVCNATGAARCRNGAQCVEGPGLDFFCKCQPGWEGTLCETEIDECASNPCQNGGVCVDKLGDYACACYIGFTGHDCERPVLECADNPCANGALCLMEFDEPRCYCVPDFHGERCDEQYDECQLGPRCINGGTCIDGVDGFTCSCPPGITGLLCECLELQYDLLDCTYIRPNISTTEIIPITIPVTTITTTTTETTTSTELTTYTTTESTTTFSTHTTTVEMTTEPETTTVTTESTSSQSKTPETTTEEITTSEETTLSTTTEQPLTIPITKFPETITEEETTTKITETTTELTTVVTNSSATDVFTTESTASTTEITRFFTDGPDLTPDLTPEVTTHGWTSSSSSSSPSSTETTTTDFTTLVTSISETGCKYLYCANGGSCVTGSDGAKCVCPFKFTGPTCSIPIRVQSAAFGGTSYLSHRLVGPALGSITNGLDVEVQARTLSPDGLLLHSSIGDNAYMTVYLRMGLLRFRFSCGVQTMLLGENQAPVNNGNEMRIRARLDFNADHSHCNASLRVNDTLAMSGDQLSRLPGMALGFPWRGSTWLHLGGAPRTQETAGDNLGDSAQHGFVGCMRGLKIGGKFAHIFTDALGGSDVVECAAFACLSSPCLNGAACHQSGDSWHCACKSGFTGRSCERSVCSNNPCLYGATCAPFPGSGFICLCPLGKHGQFCEYNLEIAQPSFATTLSGLSSYVAYPINGPVGYSMEIRLKIVPRTQEQISLIAFMGQAGIHDQGSDHLAISYIKGYIMLTWNLGSGARRIFTSKPIQPLPAGQPHVIRAGRTARRAWLWVEGIANITGRSPGHLQKLDVEPTLYIGGHESKHFTPLPHDLPLHGGFFGCIYDVELKSGKSAPQAVQDTRLAHGRGVGRCKISECHAHACHPGSACLQHGAAFTCLCGPGKAGPRCDNDKDPCEVSGNQESRSCHPEAHCVAKNNGQADCDCPMGRFGRRCDKIQNISDASFSGVRSYLTLPPGPLLGPQYILGLELRPLSERGIVLFSGNSLRGFICLSLQGGVLELRLKASSGKVTTIRSGRVLAKGEWHRVRITRFGRRVSMWAEGVANSGTVQYTENYFLYMNEASNRIHIGGLPDLSQLPFGAVSGFPIPLKGCVRNLHFNSIKIALNSTNVREARNVGDCDGTACGSDLCDNNGECVLNEMPGMGPTCRCPKRHEGTRCEHKTSCSNSQPCERGGRCIRSDPDGMQDVEGRCECPPGVTGKYCDEVLQPGSLQFSGRSYLKAQNGNSIMKDKRSKGTLKIQSDVINDSVQLNFSTIQQDGLIIWCAQGEKFTGVGIEAGYLKFVTSSLGSIRTPNSVSDGDWHQLSLAWSNGQVYLHVDQQVLYNQTTLADEICGFGDVYIGGFPYNQSTEIQTDGTFLESFSGCLQELSFGDENSIDFTKSESENLEMCKWI